MDREQLKERIKRELLAAVRIAEIRQQLGVSSPPEIERAVREIFAAARVHELRRQTGVAMRPELQRYMDRLKRGEPDEYA
jgi:hypothetical protein